MRARQLVWSPVALMALAAAVYAYAGLSNAASHILWMDEVLAVSAARLPTAHQVVGAIWAGAEFSPPTYDLLLHGLFSTVGGGHSRIIPRLPSLLAGYGAAACIWSMLRATGFSAWASALGFALTLAGGLFDYFVQARPYALMGLSYAVALWGWLRFPSAARPGVSAGVTAAGLALAVSLHFYGVILIASVVLMEAGRCFIARRWRWEMAAALAVAGLAAMAWYPLARHLAAFNAADVTARYFYARPRLSTISAAVSETVLGGAPFTLTLITGGLFAVGLEGLRRQGVTLRGDVQGPRPPTMNSDLALVMLGLAAIPVMTIMLGVLVTHAFSARYVSAAALLPALAGPVLVDRLAGRRIIAAVLVVCCCAVLLSRRGEPYSHAELVTALEQLDPRPPIVLGEGLLFIELGESAPPDLARRFVYLTSPAAEGSPDPTNEHQVERLTAWRPALRVVKRDDFLKTTRDFYVLTRPGVTMDVVSPYLAAHGRLGAPTALPDDAELYRSVGGVR